MLLADLGERLLAGGDPITFDEALAVAELPDSDVPALIALAHRVRLERSGPGVELESIVSAKTGACSEDCSFCSQSRHWRSPLRPEPFIDLEEMVGAARAAEAIGSNLLGALVGGIAESLSLALGLRALLLLAMLLYAAAWLISIRRPKPALITV